MTDISNKIYYPKLRGRITEKYGSIKAFADDLGKTQVNVSNKLNKRTGFSMKDVESWSLLLDIARCDIGDYFLLP